MDAHLEVSWCKNNGASKLKLERTFDNILNIYRWLKDKDKDIRNVKIVVENCKMDYLETEHSSSINDAPWIIMVLPC
jgi:hypothetical protein